MGDEVGSTPLCRGALRLPLPRGLLPLVGSCCHRLTAAAATDTTLRFSWRLRGHRLCLGA